MKGESLVRLIGLAILLVGVFGLWGGLAVVFKIYNPLGVFTIGVFSITVPLFASDFASVIFWFIIALLGFALMSPAKEGYSRFLRR